MAKDPTYPMYAQDFDMDTSFLSNEEVGVYIRLLNACWINNGLPTDLKKLSRICRISDSEFKEIWNEIKGKFFEKNGKFFNQKQEEVREYRYQQKVNGSKGGRPKKNKDKNPNETQPKSEIKPKQNLSNEIEIEYEKEIEDEKGGVGEKVIFPFEDEEFFDQWNLWKDYKNKEFKFKYKTIQSEQAALKQLSGLAKGNSQNAIEILHQSMANGWKGFFELKQKQNGKPTINRQTEETYTSNSGGW